MKMKIVLGLVVIAALVAAGRVAWRCDIEKDAATRDPFLQPGETWTSFNGWVGSRLILLHDGRYAVVDVCDICDSRDYRYGQWRDSSGTVRLTSATSKARQFVAERRTIDGCEWLVDVTPDAKFHPAFVRENSGCESRLSSPRHEKPTLAPVVKA